MGEINIFNAKMHFSSLVEKVFSEQKEMTITRRGKKVAKIIPFQQTKQQKISSVLKELDLLNQEIGKVGMSLKEIQRMREEGRR